MTFKMMAILSSLPFLTVPTLVFAANAHTPPKGLLLVFDDWKKGRVVLTCALFFWINFAICCFSWGSAVFLLVPFFL